MFIQVNEYLINTNAIKYIEKYDWIATFGVRILFIGDIDYDIQYKFELSSEIRDLMHRIEIEERYIEKKYTTQENIDKIDTEIARAKKERDEFYAEIIKNWALW